MITCITLATSPLDISDFDGYFYGSMLPGRHWPAMVAEMGDVSSLFSPKEKNFCRATGSSHEHQLIAIFPHTMIRERHIAIEICNFASHEGGWPLCTAIGSGDMNKMPDARYHHAFRRAVGNGRRRPRLSASRLSP